MGWVPLKTHLQLYRKAKALAVLTGWLAIACNRHPTAPDEVQFVAATINVTATLPAGAERILAISRARVRLVQQPAGSEALDTTVAIQFSGNNVNYLVSLQIPAEGITVTASLSFMGASGAPIFEADPIDVEVRPGNSSIQIPELNYVGPGSNAASISFSSPDRWMFFGDTIRPTVEVLDGFGSTIVNPPILWRAVNSDRLTVPDFSNSLSIAPSAEPRIAGDRTALGSLGTPRSREALSLFR